MTASTPIAESNAPKPLRTDDAGLIAFMTAGRTPMCNDFSLDRSVSPVRLVWQKYQYWDGAYVAMGLYDSIPIVAGDRIDPTCPRLYPQVAGPGVRDMTGMWVSDQYGRPMTLADIVAS